MKVCRVSVKIEPEEEYWKRQALRLKRAEKSGAAVRSRNGHAELVFASLGEMARALTPKRIELLRLVRRHEPSSARGLAALAQRDVKNVLADVRVLETLGLLENERRGGERHRKALRTDFGRIEVRVEL